MTDADKNCILNSIKNAEICNNMNDMLINSCNGKNSIIHNLNIDQIYFKNWDHGFCILGDVICNFKDEKGNRPDYLNMMSDLSFQPIGIMETPEVLSIDMYARALYGIPEKNYTMDCVMLTPDLIDIIYGTKL